MILENIDKKDCVETNTKVHVRISETRAFEQGANEDCKYCLLTVDSKLILVTKQNLQRKNIISAMAMLLCKYATHGYANISMRLCVNSNQIIDFPLQKLDTNYSLAKGYTEHTPTIEICIQKPHSLAKGHINHVRKMISPYMAKLSSYHQPHQN